VPKPALRFVALLATAALAAGCTKVGPGSTGGASGNPWTHHGRLVYAEYQDAKSLNPMLATSTVIGDLSSFLFSYTVRYDEHAHPVPDALREVPTLENGDVSRDGLTLRYKLRTNIYFHDGVRLTCRDLAFTWRAVMNPANNDITHDGYNDIKSIDCSNPSVAVIHMKRVYAPFLQQLWGLNGNVPILPEHLLAKFNDSKGSFNTAPYQAAPVGSGPFKFVRWNRGQEVELAAFDRYFLGKPKLRTVVFKTLPDESTEVAQLKTHEIDLGARIGNDVWPEARNIPNTVAVAAPTYEFDHIDFNLRRPIFADVRLRRALELALDRKAILEKVEHGNGDLSDTAISPFSPYYDSHVTTFHYDLPRALRELDALGWKVGPGGVRIKNGQRLAFTFGTQTESNTGRALEAFVQSAWHDAGAAVTIKNVPTAQFFDNTANGILQGGKYDVATFAWTAAADPDDSAIYSGRNLAPQGQNALFWNDPLANKAMADGLGTVDPVKRKAASFAEQERFALDVPSIVIVFRREPYVYNTDLRGFKASPVISPFWNPIAYSL
jgi:peptide/nickel transport system substrate-binding protein